MGAGSAKGLRRSASSDDIDNLSVSSDGGRWGESDRIHDGGVTGTSIAPLDENKRSKSFEFPSSFSKRNELKVSNGGEEGGGGIGNQGVSKRGGGRKIWNFFSDKDDPDERPEVNKEDSNNNNSNNQNNKRFTLFGRKQEAKDKKLDSEINDLEKTFDSLGIVGKSVWEGSQDSKPARRSKDDLATLEPMRNRHNVRAPRPPRGINGLTALNSDRRLDTTASDMSTTSSNRKKFVFSWDTEEEDENIEVDEWDYRAVS